MCSTCGTCGKKSLPVTTLTPFHALKEHIWDRIRSIASRSKLLGFFV